MYRYFAIRWEGADARAGAMARDMERRIRATGEAWSVALDSDGLVILHTGAVPRRFEAVQLDRHGVVLGKVFVNSGASLVEKADRIVESSGRVLVEECWGRYVAFLRQRDGTHCVVRDPTGALPCYFTRVEQVSLVFSHMEDCLAVSRHRFGIDWNHVAAYLLYPRLISQTTGFLNVGSLHAGAALRLDSRGPSERCFHWNPANVIERGIVEDERAAEKLLREAVTRGVSGWASCYSRILHQLSGGLDSSIVLAALSGLDRRPDVVCFNLYTETAEGDERRFARLVAQHLHQRLVEVVYRPAALSFDSTLNVSSLASPALVGLNSESEATRAQIAERYHSEVLFSGQGGDHLFQRRRNAHIAAEYVHRHGLRGPLLRIALDTARMTRTSVWSVLNTAVRARLRDPQIDPYACFKPPAFLDPGLPMAAMRQAIQHPWLAGASGLPETKRQQIFDVIDTQNYYSEVCRYADIAHPLISQPLIEATLRIPSYVLTTGGVERALARRAFSASLPREVLYRTSKGGATGYFHNLILRNVGMVRELLLDGQLQQQAVIDRGKLEEALSEKQLVQGEQIDGIIVSVIAECWLRSVQAIEQRLAA